MDIERALLSKIVATGDLETVITRGLTPEHFADEGYRDTYMYIVAHARQHNKPPSTAAFRADRPDFELLHVEDSMTWVMDKMVQLVKHRKANEAVLELGRAIKDPERVKNIDLEFLEVARDLATIVPTTKVARFSDMAKRIDKFEEDKAAGKKTGIPFGFPSLDEWTGGIQPHEFGVIAAYSGIGKSTFLQQVAFNVFTAGFTPLIISLEMEHSAIFRKFDAMFARLNYRKLKHLELTDGDVEGWREEAAKRQDAIDHRDIPVIDSIRHCTPEHVFGETVKHKPDIVMVDYITLMRPSHGRNASLWQGITEITQDLKQNARTLGIPILAAAQLNRAGKDDASTENTGYSISIVQDSDIYVGITRIKDPNDKDEYLENQVEIHLNKNRDGRLGKFVSVWNHDELDFREMKPNEPVQFTRKRESEEEMADKAAAELTAIEKADEELKKEMASDKKENPFLKKDKPNPFVAKAKKGTS